MSGRCADAELIASVLDSVTAFFAESGCPLTADQVAAVADAQAGVERMRQTYVPVERRKRVAA